MLQRQRDELIIKMLRGGAAASVHELASQIGVSLSTIRRDLHRLDSSGEITRVYGGAVVEEQTREGPFAEIFPVDANVKEAVAARAAALVADDDVILLDIGTTTTRLARHLRGRRVTVITSSLSVLDVLRDDATVQLVLLGGMVRRNFQTVVGSLTADALRQVSADRLFLGCAGVRTDGKVVDDMMIEVLVKRGMIAAAQSVVLLASEKKFPGKGSSQICELSDIDVVVTTPGYDKDILDPYRKAGGEVLIA